MDSVARTIKAGGVDQGKEPEPTIYWRNRKIDGPRYHIDYCFVPDYWIDESLAVDVGRFKEWVLSDEQVALMERESASLAREFKVAEQTYGADHLDLVLANGYVSKLLRNGRVVGYLAKNYQELLFEFQKINEGEASAA